MCILFRSGEQIVSGEDINYSKLDTIDWNQGEVERFQEVVDKSYQQLLCGHKEVSAYYDIGEHNYYVWTSLFIRMQCLKE